MILTLPKYKYKNYIPLIFYINREGDRNGIKSKLEYRFKKL